MRLSKHNAVVAAGLTAILSLGVTGCSFSSSHESSSSVSTSVTDENGVTETTETTTTDTDGNVETTTTTNKIIDISDWTDAWIGQTDAGQTMFYAQSPDGGAQGVFAVYDPETDEVMGVVGDNSVNEEGDEVTCVDADSGKSVDMVIREQDDDNTLVINVGEEYGDTVMTPVSMDDFLDELAAVDVNGVVLSQ